MIFFKISPLLQTNCLVKDNENELLENDTGYQQNQIAIKNHLRLDSQFLYLSQISLRA